MVERYWHFAKILCWEKNKTKNNQTVTFSSEEIGQGGQEQHHNHWGNCHEPGDAYIIMDREAAVKERNSSPKTNPQSSVDKKNDLATMARYPEEHCTKS